MKNQDFFYSDGTSPTDDKIHKTLNAEFELPEAVRTAREEAFEKILLMSKKKDNETNTKKGPALQNGMETFMEKTSDEPDSLLSEDKQPADLSLKKFRKAKHSGNKKHLRTGFKVLAGAAAAAAIFSGVCITNPAWAANLPVVGGVLAKIGESLGYSGDYSKYAEPISDGSTDKTTSGNDNAATGVNSGSADEAASSDGQNAVQTTEGAAAKQWAADLNRTEAARAPDTGSTTSDTKSTGLSDTENADTEAATDSSLSQTIDGVTVTLSDVYYNDTAINIGFTIYSEEAIPDTQLWTETKDSADINPGSDSRITFNDDPEMWIANIAADCRITDEHTITGVFRGEMEQIPDEAPEHASVRLDLLNIVGTKPEDQQNYPEMPQELIDEYNQKMAENGLEPDDYENFTEEQKDLECQFRNEQWNEFIKLYPDAAIGDNPYQNWIFKGNWSFTFDVDKNTADTVTKEINLMTGEGYGVISVTRSPFEIVLNEEFNDQAGNYFPVATDANGDMLPSAPWGGYVNTYAIQDRDVSKIDVYICDYDQYMDEIKGYYLADDYEEKRKTKTFKQYLDEKALAHAEVVFDDVPAGE